ncbi:hypothetical protein NB646_03955 [Oxalobacter aliiformigenes]|uniref:Uncharacterized protein n=1 Tax=Oxalobacter aliiformigenes TaxID=2946593 RepID=A0A9E9NUS1_9BURK|nr:hypothetical protein [Oxalobacter aliiformigenes]WAV91892.1 hypothetical protein NB646_03955 [Oxalobacter aliiformigenes]
MSGSDGDAGIGLCTAFVRLQYHTEIVRKSGSRENRQGQEKGGGYYLDDGPMDEVPDNLLEVPDAKPRVEKLASGPNKPYVVFGRTYTPMTQISAYRKKGWEAGTARNFMDRKPRQASLMTCSK